MNRPASSKNEGQILPFRPRGSLFTRPTPQPPAVPDLEKYEHAKDEPDDFRHRMLMNVLAVAFTAALVGGGIWIADVMASMRKNQDCVLVGRPGCTPVAAPLQPR